MHKRLLGAVLAMGALLADSQASQPAQSTATDNAPVEGKTIRVTIDGRTVPVKALGFASQPAQTTVPVHVRPLAGLSQVRFVERPGRRKVKYGKGRWVILG